LILADKLEVAEKERKEMKANEEYLGQENIRKLQKLVFIWLRERFLKELGSRFPSYFS